MMRTEPILIHDARLTFEDVALRRLVELFAVSCRTVDISSFDAVLEGASVHELTLLASAATIHSWCQTYPDPTSAFDRMRQQSSHIFLYGFTPDTPKYIAREFSDGVITDVRKFTRRDLRYDVSSCDAEITKEFSGLSFGYVNDATDYGFAGLKKSNGMVPLVNIEDKPFWILVPKDGCKTFLLACSAIADIEEQVDGEIDVNKYFSRLLPAAMFVRSSLKNRSWHSKYRFANFIIDDPPLKRSYGCLNYRELLSTMDQAGFASTIAFIPWNYRRTHSEVTELFRERPDRLSLCVHGCDHTAAEFSTTDLAVLNSRVQLASARMESLHRETRLSYSKAMVFPQGGFSTAAVKALKSNNYLAAVNSSSLPVNSAPEFSLTVADLLGPAITRYGGFPVFLRRYPGRLEQCALDLFLGKPVLIVEHHGYLKDRGERLADFVRRLNSLAKPEWRGLDEILAKSYLECETSDESTSCKLYTNYQVIHNHTGHDRTFVVTKGETDDVPIEAVLINGQPAEFAAGNGLLEFTLRIPAFSSKALNIRYGNVLPCVNQRRALASRTGVWTRRMLSEFRDNILCRKSLLLSTAQALRGKFLGSVHRHDHASANRPERAPACDN